MILEQIAALREDLKPLLLEELAALIRSELPAASQAVLEPDEWENGSFFGVTELRDAQGRDLMDDLLASDTHGGSLSMLESEITDCFGIGWCGERMVVDLERAIRLDEATEPNFLR